MTDFNVTDAQAFLRGLRSAVQFAQAIVDLDELKNVEVGYSAAIAEKQKALADLDAVANAHEARAAQAKAELVQAKADAQKAVDDAKAQIAYLQSKAQASADKMISDAQITVDSLKAQAATIRETVGSLSLQVTAKQAELAAIQSEIDKLRAKING